MKELRLGCVGVHAVSMQQAVEQVAARVASGEAGYVLTPNVDHVVMAQTCAPLAAAYQDVFLSIPDGMPLVWASRLLGQPLPERVSGADLVGPLLAKAAQLGWSVYLLGGRPGSAVEAARRLQHATPNLRLVGAEAPWVAESADDAESHAAFERVKAAKPNLLLVGLGCPKQERWIHNFALRLPGTVSLGIGASIDFLAGAVPRAPRWMSQNGLEWAYRLFQEPRRMWRRYLVRDPVFFLMVARMMVARARENP